MQMSRDCKPKGLTWNARARFHARFHSQTLHASGQDASAALQVRWQQKEDDSLPAAHVGGRGSDRPRSFGNAVINVPGNVGGEGSDIVAQVLRASRF